MEKCPVCESEKISFVMNVPCSDSCDQCMYQCDDCQKVFVDW